MKLELQNDEETEAAKLVKDVLAKKVSVFK